MLAHHQIQNYSANLPKLLVIKIAVGCFFLASLLLLACNTQSKEEPAFVTLSSKVTGLDFVNKMKPTPAFNLLSYMYYYNGAGVGAGDFNNDGLIDLFFAANQDSNRLYLNKGKLKFEDKTTQAGIPNDGSWSTGVSVVDINNDGLLDIYVCKVGQYKVLKGVNQLLVCKTIDANGVPHYQDEAEAYGLDFSGFSTQAAFLDFDRDGDLDMFLLNHSVNHDGNYAPRSQFLGTFDSLAGQRFYRNDSKPNTAVHFTDITNKAGIHSSRIGYGLGVCVADINSDGWPDLYVGNDFHENDYCYINQQNGSFADETTGRMMHTSQFSMGVDVADINNDALPEIVSMDMLPYDPYMLRRSLAEDDYNIYQQKIRFGYNYQYARNNLQLNKGNGHFSEIGQYAGINATDWSWAALWMDFDNDGSKDLFVSNGIPKRMNDIDYISFVSNEELQQRLRTNGVQEKDMTLINNFPEVKLPNQFFSNRGNCQFQNIANRVGGNTPSFSNGAVYADFDNDGDQDIVVNNIDDAVLLYQNTANDSARKAYASLKLHGAPGNINALGTRLLVTEGKKIYYYESSPVHGFLSSMQVPLHIGLANIRPDSAFLIWPDNSFQRIVLAANKSDDLYWQPGLPQFNYRSHIRLFTDSSTSWQSSALNFLHQENEFNEYNREPLLPHFNSAEGPAIAVADINQDGLQDFFVGAAKGHHNAVMLQQKDGSFITKPQPALWQDSMWENTAACFADVNGDRYPDLLLANGGNEYYQSDAHMQPLLYLNDGKGNFSKQQNAFPVMNITAGCLAVHDVDADGDTDVFIGGRCMPWKYGEIPRSYLLLNNGKGVFTDATAQWNTKLQYAGLVTDACWADMDGDNVKDLLLCSEWGAIDCYVVKNRQMQHKVVCPQNGWWSKLLCIDADGDGDNDVVACNFGLNGRLKASEKQPMRMYYQDFDNNGTSEQVLTYHVAGQEIPFATKQELERQMPFIKKKYLYAADFAKTSLPELLGAEKLNAAIQYKATQLATTVLINKSQMKFEQQPLPWQCQLSNYRAASVVDVNHDKLPDVLLMGNYYHWNVEIGRSDADYGTLLVNKGKGIFEPQQLGKAVIKGEVRHIAPIVRNNKTVFLLAMNNDSLRILQQQ
jgi:enediyne biosynthesis protein E4